MTATDPTKATIVLIHGLWMTPKSWDTWAERFRAQGGFRADAEILGRAARKALRRPRP